MGITCKDINRRLAAAGYPMVTIERGEGYVYFIYDSTDADGALVYGSHSIMTPYLSDLPHDTWVSYGVDFAESMMEERYDHSTGTIRPRKETPVKKIVETIDLTPTWAGIMPGLIAVLEDGTAEGRTHARAELMRLARLVDEQNAANKEIAA